MPIFAKLEGITSYSTDSTHLGWMDLLTMQFSGENRSHGSTPTNSLAGEVKFGELPLTASWSATTVALYQKMSENEVVPEVTIEVCAPDVQRTVLKRYVLTNVRVVSAKDASTEGGQMIDDISLDYEAITLEYLDPNGVFVNGGWSKKDRKRKDPAPNP